MFEVKKKGLTPFFCYNLCLLTYFDIAPLSKNGLQCTFIKIYLSLVIIGVIITLQFSQ